MKAIGAGQNEVAAVEGDRFPDIRLDGSLLADGSLDYVGVRVAERLFLFKKAVADHLGHQGVITRQAPEGPLAVQVQAAVADVRGMKQGMGGAPVDDGENGRRAHRGAGASLHRRTDGRLRGFHRLPEDVIPRFGAARPDHAEAGGDHDLRGLPSGRMATHAIGDDERQTACLPLPCDAGVLVLLPRRSAHGEKVEIAAGCRAGLSHLPLRHPPSEIGGVFRPLHNTSSCVSLP